MFLLLTLMRYIKRFKSRRMLIEISFGSEFKVESILFVSAIYIQPFSFYKGLNEKFANSMI